MSIPVIQSLVQSQGQFVQVLKTFPFKRQRTQLLPPWLNQVQPAGVLRDKQGLDIRYWPYP